MPTTLQSAQSKSCGPSGLHPVRPVKIVMFYEEFSDAIRAHRMFDLVARKCGRSMPVNATSWSFGLLGKPELYATILNATALADVVIVAAEGNRELPALVAKWIDQCMHGNSGAKTVVALHDEGAEANDARHPLCLSLKRIANRLKAAFMRSGDFDPHPALHFSSHPRLSASASSIRVTQPVTHPLPSASRWWGINE